MFIATVSFLLLAACMVTDVGCSKGPLQAKNLRCERNRVGSMFPSESQWTGVLSACRFATDSSHPLLSWSVEHSGRGATQTAYRVVVYTAEGGKNVLRKLWDSGQVKSDNSFVRYSGAALHSLRRHYFTVQWWDQDGTAAPISDPGCFFTSLMNGESPEAFWITAKGVTGAPLFRKEFDTNEEMFFGSIGINGLGFYRLFVNGIELNTTTSSMTAALRPAWTQYDRRTPMDVYEVDSIVKGQRKVVIGVMLGLGWRNKKDYPNKDHLGQDEDERVLRAFVQVALPYYNLTSFGTDDSWLVHPSPIVSDTIFDGETYNASMEIPYWSSLEYKPTGMRHTKVTCSILVHTYVIICCCANASVCANVHACMQ